MTEPLLQMHAIVKQFPGVRALDGVDLDVVPGEVHCLLGQNGAGKSTLIKVLAGVHQPDEGSITWQGDEVRLANPIAAMRLGIATIYQELDLVDGLTVTENIYLGHEMSTLGLIPPWRRPTRRGSSAGPARTPRDIAASRGWPALGRGKTDRQHGSSTVSRRQAHRDGRAVGGPRPERGPPAVPRDP